MTENFNYSQTVQVYSGRTYDDDFLPDNLFDAIAWLQTKLDSIPAEHRFKASIELEGDYDGGSPTLTIDYQRPPTAEEIDERRNANRVLAAKQVERARAEVVKAEKRLADFGGVA